MSDAMRVHALQTGRLYFKEVLLRGPGGVTRRFVSSLLPGKPWIEMPVFVYVIEHPEGLIVVDTGPVHEMAVPETIRRQPGGRLLLRFTRGEMTPEEDIGPQLQGIGLQPSDVRWLLPTHLHIDHAGALRYFRDAQILVHRPEYDFARSRRGRFPPVYLPGLWPDWFEPTTYDLEARPFGPFPESLAVTADVTCVPIPGHSIGQVAVIVKREDTYLFFGGDHHYRQAWFEEELRTGRLIQAYQWPRKARETQQRVTQFVREFPTVYLPAHDFDAPRRLAERALLTV